MFIIYITRLHYARRNFMSTAVNAFNLYHQESQQSLQHPTTYLH